MGWEIVLAVLFGALLHALWNVQVKAGEDRWRGTILVAIGGGMVTIPALVALPLPASACVTFLCGSVLIHLLYFLLLAFCYQKGELSVVYPLTRGSAPALTTLAALVLVNESPSLLAWSGVASISLGAVVLIAVGQRGGIRYSPSVLLALLNALVIVGYTMVDGVGARLSGHPLSYTAWLLFLTAALILVAFLVRERRRALLHLVAHWRVAVVGGACLSTSYGLALWAMTRAPIALVGALRETSIVFGVILAGCILKEPITTRRWLSIGLIVAGAVFLKVG